MDHPRKKWVIFLIWLKTAVFPWVFCGYRCVMMISQNENDQRRGGCKTVNQASARLPLDSILEVAVREKASDVHLTVGVPPILRINGKLLHLGESNLTNEECGVYARELLNDRLWEQFQEKGECDTSYTIQNDVNFRVNVFRQKGNYGAALRLIPSQLPTLDSLHLPSVFRTLCNKRNGLILITGPTGSGKTTTLAAMIEYMLRTRNEHIITLEDPIEYIFPHGCGIVNQRQVGTDTESFDIAIRSALREDIDVIMVGEMRDLATISAALTAAETGHLVLATLHTIGAAQTIDRVVDVFPAEQQSQIRVQLSSVLEAVVSQQLLPNTEQNGRELALEIMLSNHAIANLIREGRSSQIQNMIQLNNNNGMITMDQSLISLFRAGKIDEYTMLKYCVDQQEIRRLTGR